MSPAAQLREQVRADLLVYLRTPVALFFSALLPIIFLVIFTSIFGNEIDERTGLRVATQQVPAFAALTVVSSAFVGLVVSVVSAREAGVLKRARATPAPATIVLAGRVAVAASTSLVVILVLLIIGRLLYDVALPLRTVPAVLTTVLVGAVAFAALGLAFSRLAANPDAATAITNLIALPLYFVSGVFIPESQLPDGLVQFASLLPMQPLNDALFAAFASRSGMAFSPGDLAVVAAWGIAGAIVAVTTFRWVPQSDAQ